MSKTSRLRVVALTAFDSFCTRILGDVDPERVWIDLCGSHPVAKAICQRFLRWYVETSAEVNVYYREDDDSPREWRSVNAASTVDLLWKDLVGHANANVLRNKREENPEEALRWTVKYTDVQQGRLCDSVSQITNVGQTSRSVFVDWCPKATDQSPSIFLVDRRQTRTRNGSHASPEFREERSHGPGHLAGPEHLVTVQLERSDPAAHTSRIPLCPPPGLDRRISNVCGGGGGLPPS